MQKSMKILKLKIMKNKEINFKIIVFFQQVINIDMDIKNVEMNIHSFSNAQVLLIKFKNYHKIILDLIILNLNYIKIGKIKIHLKNK